MEKLFYIYFLLFNLFKKLIIEIENKFDIIFDDGVIRNVCAKAEMEEPLVLHFDKVTTSKVRLVPTDYGQAKGFGVSEVLFYHSEG